MNIWNLDTDDESKLPPYDKEVIVLCGPDPKGFEYKGKTIKPMTYGKGGWNVEHVKYWADIMEGIV